MRKVKKMRKVKMVTVERKNKEIKGLPLKVRKKMTTVRSLEDGVPLPTPPLQEREK